MANDTYGQPDIIQEKNFIVKVYSPIITEKERNRRMNLIKQASVNLVLSKETTNEI